MSKRAVFVAAVGSSEYAKQAIALGRSLKLLGDQTTRVIFTDQVDLPWNTCYHQILIATAPWTSIILTTVLDIVDADQILILHSDMIAFKRLGPIFDYCEGRGCCVQGATASPFSKEVKLTPKLKEESRQPEVLTAERGLIYLERSAAAAELLQLARTRDLELKDDPNVKEHQSDRPADLANLLSLIKHPAIHLIPDYMNFSFGGRNPCVQPRVDVTANTCRFISLSPRVKAVEPFLWHADTFHEDRLYTSQIRSLEKLAKIESSTERGFIPMSMRTRRSIDKRILKLRGKL